MARGARGDARQNYQDMELKTENAAMKRKRLKAKESRHAPELKTNTMGVHPFRIKTNTSTTQNKRYIVC